MPIVRIRGYAMVLAEERRHGFELIQKPYSVDSLTRVLQQAIARRTLAV